MTRPSSLRVSRRYLADYGYQEGHMPGDEDCPAHKIGDGAFVPADILDRPDWYTAFRSQLRYFWRDLLKAQGNANAKLTMYRALPTKYDTFNRGDWVSLSPQYAHGHAAGNVAGGPAHVIKATVPAKHLLWPGDDLMEWGYFGPKIEGEVVPEGRRASSSVNKWDLEDDLNDAKSKREVKEILRKHDAREVKLPNRETVWVLPDRKPEFVVEEWRGDWSVQEIYDYIWGADLTDIFPKSDERFNDDFWDYPAPLYHNTTEGNVEDIEAEGLLPMDKTRGISNRSTGSAVFTTSDPDESSMGSYGPVAYEIDTPAMKKDGYKPFVSQEEPIMEAELQSALASLLGMDDFYPDIEQGLSHYTVVVFGAIPPKYLTRVD